MNYYNDNDPKICKWLRGLISDGLISDGVVDERSIEEVQPEDLRGYNQCHFFAGIGGWSYALRLAGIPDDEPIWTGSCPCQPFSVGNLANGGAKGQDDNRHAWPQFLRLIRKQSPAIILGEQVSSAIKWGWWDEAATDLEDSSYSVAAAIIPANCLGADHERKRLWWIAHSECQGRKRHQHNNSLSGSTQSAHSIRSNPFIEARKAVEGDCQHLLSVNGLSVQMARDSVKGFGNAIVPQVAAAFIQAAYEAIAEQFHETQTP